MGCGNDFACSVAAIHPGMSYARVRAEARRVLPGVRYRRGLLWRYSLVWRKPGPQ
ncbi:hypothetical protein SRB5_23010 [Streptomyces sp. RB5]|uniref:Uncharacterized protein n=1 Tax=Streptomyces smaragdinus TaxID=2585196 RepID=A0A7K0CFB9_9ACTN|nr:hypothetical protein [Streptomyces smaragdinus]MQY12171.1 hypothetical protein [Streptomyces smaragdinus]